MSRILSLLLPLLLSILVCHTAQTKLQLDKSYEMLMSGRGGVSFLDDSVENEINWCNRNGTDFCIPVRNQHVPNYCGSCYAFAITSSYSDRLKIETGQEVFLSTQNILSCVFDATCFGAEPTTVMQYMKEKGVPDETCSPYLAEEGFQCIPENECYTYSAWNDRKTIARWDYERFYVKDFGVITGENEMLNHLQNGPIACTLNAIADFEKWNSTEVFTEPGERVPDHTIEIVGYGEEKGTKYWLIKNSWGTAFNPPMRGFIKILRGGNLLGVENLCMNIPLRKIPFLIHMPRYPT